MWLYRYEKKNAIVYLKDWKNINWIPTVLAMISAIFVNVSVSFFAGFFPKTGNILKMGYQQLIERDECIQMKFKILKIMYIFASHNFVGRRSDRVH